MIAEIKAWLKEHLAKCQDCGKRREIFRKAKCYPCYQAYLDRLAESGQICKEAANLWRILGRKA